MKIVNKHRRAYFIAITKKRTWANLKKKRNNDYFKGRKKRILLRQEKGLKKETITIYAPQNFSLSSEGDRNDLLVFLKKIKNLLHCGHNVHISFSKTERLSPSGTLFFVANIEQMMFFVTNRNRIISCDYPTDDTVEQLFQHIGFLKLLGNSNYRKQITAENVKHWHYIKGTSTDAVIKFEELLQSVSDEYGLRSGLFDCMSEAVTNSIHHANSERLWRMFAQNVDDSLEIAICDLGIGIPGSLRKKPELKKFIRSAVHSIRNRHDSYWLQIAVGSNITSTKLPFRGKGLKDMLEFAKMSDIGGFRIFSGKGLFDYDAHHEAKFTKDYKDCITGTIIHWKIPLEV